MRERGATLGSAGAEEISSPKPGSKRNSVRVHVLGSSDAFGSWGRLPACYVVESKDCRILMEAGPALLSTLKRSGFATNEFDVALISHLHGDHFGGLPFLILEYLWETRLKKTLRIAGPPRLESRTWSAFQMMFHPKDASQPMKRVRNRLRFVVLQPNQSREIAGARISTIRTPHTSPDISLGFRIELDGRVIVFSGDSGWTDDLVSLAAGADLFLCECTYFGTPRINMHLDYVRIAERRDRFQVKRMVLTHVGREVLERQSEVDIELANDGMTIEV